MSDNAALILAAFGLAAFAAAVAALHNAWHGWLKLKRIELDRRDAPPGEDRADIAELRVRVKQLEAIAACVDI
jgi:hypothetical protein